MEAAESKNKKANKQLYISHSLMYKLADEKDITDSMRKVLGTKLNYPSELRWFEFEQESTNIASEIANDSESNRTLWEKELLKIIGGDDTANSFNAFHCLFTYYRHLKEDGKLKKLYNENKSHIREHKEFYRIRWLFKLSVKEDLDDSFIKAFNKFEEMSKESEDPDPRLLNLFADLVVTYCEKNPKKSDPIDGKTKEAWLDEAGNKIEKATEEGYAKHYAVQARILAQQGKYDMALKTIDKAIKTERLSNMLRSADYHKIKADILHKSIDAKTKQFDKEVDDKIKNVDRKIKDANERSFKVIGFFIGIVSLITATIYVIPNMYPLGALLVLMGFLGMLICAFYVFSLILLGASFSDKTEKRTIKRKIGLVLTNIFVPLIGGGLIVAAIILAYCFT